MSGVVRAVRRSLLAGTSLTRGALALCGVAAFGLPEAARAADDAAAPGGLLDLCKIAIRQALTT